MGCGLRSPGAGGVFHLRKAIRVWLAQHFVTSGPFYVIATVRIALGLILISVASASRAPKALRVLGYVILILGITTALTGLVAIGARRRRPRSPRTEWTDKAQKAEALGYSVFTVPDLRWKRTVGRSSPRWPIRTPARDFC